MHIVAVEHAEAIFGSSEIHRICCRNTCWFLMIRNRHGEPRAYAALLRSNTSLKRNCSVVYVCVYLFKYIVYK